MDMANPGIPYGAIELLRRLVALILFVAAATAGFGYGRPDLAALAVVLGGLVYMLVPRPRVPPGALHHERMPAVHMPDLVGFMLTTVFFALPLIISAQERWLGGPWGLYLLTGLPGLIALYIFWIAARHQCLWLRVAGRELTIADLRGVTVLPFDAIAEVKAETRQPPRWLKPLLILFGGWRGYGIALVTDQSSHNLIIEKRDGTRLRLPADAFPDLRQIVAALSRGEVRLDAELTAGLGRAAHHHRVRRKADAHNGKGRHNPT